MIGKTLKKSMAILLTLLTVFSTSFICVASNEDMNECVTDDGFEYIIESGEVTITAYTGVASSLVIPNYINNYPVTSIGVSAFKNCKDLISVVISDSVIEIGNYAFSGCTSMKSITIPDSITKISNSMLKECTSLETVIIPNSVTSIESYAFRDCTNLTLVTLPSGLTNISWGLFSGCTNLKSVNIPNSVVVIGNSAFSGCSSLASIILPDSVKTIGEYAFSWCTSLVSVTIPNGVEIIDAHTFEGCTSLKSVDIPSSVTKIESFSFLDCTSLKSVGIPDSVTYIGSESFKNCSSFTTMVIPGSVNQIGTSAFENCANLTSVFISDGVSFVDWSAFENCKKLNSINIPDSVVQIRDEAFYNTSYYNDTSNWEDGVLYIDNALIEVDETLSGDYWIKNGTKIIAENAFSNCINLTSVVIPDSVVRINNGAFKSCVSLVSVDISNNVSDIGRDAFGDCISLTSVIIPDSVTSIGDYAFQYCENLTSVIISDSVTSIGNYAFQNCQSLNSVIIPNSVTKLGDSAFKSCGSLMSVSIPNSVTDMGSWIFQDCVNLTDVYIAEGVIDIPEFTNCTSLNSIVIPSTVTNINWCAFSGCTNLASVSIPNSVTYIGGEAFKNCTNLISIAVPESVTEIGSGAFSNCTSLASIIIPDTDIKIGTGAFFNTSYSNDSSNWYNDALYINNVLIEAKKEICGTYVLKNKTKIIADSAFEDCTSLVSVIIPHSAIEIGWGSFMDCANLTSITIPSSVTKIGYYAFSRCSDDLAIYGYKGSYAETYAKENDINFVALTEHSNADTGVTVITNNEFDLNVETIVDAEIIEEVNLLLVDQTVVKLYDITLTKDNEEVQPDSEVTVKIPSENKDAKVYRVETNGELTDMNAVYEDGYMVFATEHFSQYVLAVEKTQTDAYPEGLQYTVDEKYNYATISGYTGNESILVIPNTIEGYKVISINEYAFDGCETLEQVIISNGLTSICNYAFEKCINLKAVFVPTSIKGIQELAFNNCFYLTDIYYSGTEEEWKDIGFRGHMLDSEITIHYEATEIPTQPILPGVTEPIESTVVTEPTQIINEPTEITTTNITEVTEPTETTITFTSVSSGEETTIPEELTAKYLLGDANSDDKVNIKDATAIQKYLANMLEIDNMQLLASDADQSGKVNIKDATAVQKYLAGFDIEMPINTVIVVSDGVEEPIENASLVYEMREEIVEFPLEDGTIYYKNLVKYPYFLGESSVEVAINSRYEEIISGFKANDTDFDEMYESVTQGNNGNPPYYDNITAEVTYNQNGVVSIKETSEMWSGGMHPYHTVSGITYDLKSGKQLLWNDIIIGEKEAVDFELRKAMINVLGSYVNDYMLNVLKENTGYSLCEEGLCFFYNVGDAVSRQKIVFPFTDADSYIIMVNDLPDYSDEDLAKYIGTDILQFSTMFEDLKTTQYSAGTLSYSNNYIKFDEDRENNVYSICLSAQSDYTLCDLWFGMSYIEAYELLKEGGYIVWEEREGYIMVEGSGYYLSISAFYNVGGELLTGDTVSSITIMSKQ